MKSATKSDDSRLETQGMAASDDTARKAIDATEHRRSYNGIMTGMTHVGVPAAMGLALFFTMLTMGLGWWSLVGLIGCYLFVAWVVKTFFAAH
jgi:Flp pilus assembly protein TadB